jgi:hypothetical protein
MSNVIAVIGAQWGDEVTSWKSVLPEARAPDSGGPIR